MSGNILGRGRLGRGDRGQVRCFTGGTRKKGMAGGVHSKISTARHDCSSVLHSFGISATTATLCSLSMPTGRRLPLQSIARRRACCDTQHATTAVNAIWDRSCKCAGRPDIYYEEVCRASELMYQPQLHTNHNLQPKRVLTQCVNELFHVVLLPNLTDSYNIDETAELCSIAKWQKASILLSMIKQ